MRVQFHICIRLTFILCLANIAVGQESKPADISRSVTVTALASNGRVRFTAPSSVVQIRLELYDSMGKKLFDNELRGGNVLDWHLQDGQSEPLPDDSYLCVVTVKGISGRITQRIGSVRIEKSSASLQPADSSQITAQQAQAIGPVEEDAQLAVLKDDNQTTTATVIAHNGEDGQIIRGRGALSFRIGDFYSGKDTEQMRLSAEGNLGIGITNPQVRLDVDGLIRATRGIVFPDGTTQYSAASRTLGAKSSMPDRLSDQILGGRHKFHTETQGTGTQDHMAKWTDNSGTLGDTALTESNGSVVVGNPSFTGNIQIFGAANADIFSGIGPDVVNGPAFNYGYAGNSFGRSAGFFNVRPDASATPPNPSLRFATANVQRMIIDNQGNVGIGTTNPTQGKLQVEGGNSNGVVGNSSSGVGVYGASTQFEGVHGEASNINHGGVVGVHNGSGIGVYGASKGTGVLGESTSATGFGGYFKSPAGGVPLGVEGYIAFNDIGTGKLSYIQSINGDLIFIPPSFHSANSSAMVVKDTTGNVAIGARNPTARLSVNGAGAFNATGAARFDLYNTTLGDGYLQHVTDDGSWQIATINGAVTRMLIDPAGNIRQLNPSVSGLVKAMVYVKDDGTIVRCYNGVTGSSSGNCGFPPVDHFTNGGYTVDFGFDISDRFYSVTPQYFNGCIGGGCPIKNVGANFELFSSTALHIFTFATNSSDTSDRSFMVIVY